MNNSQSECRYFYVLAIIIFIYNKHFTLQRFYTHNENKNIMKKNYQKHLKSNNMEVEINNKNKKTYDIHTNMMQNI